ncbi:AEC family transporter [Serpentinicella alkaliphila]|uniref:Auxin efflux family transporter n=1 Tax=Serpentinicella alkaliphila TaxID=1734049 RepID=A0A4R2TUR3_9FIRM|nr:AEC family transporter [Serpentinicella alkaliphila]QUH27069.1 AEC family transporter [Serpentinicella alkaliphila]TCQ05195.1 auxin efflux family transporter [Serpentinicella alkaliphila]
MDIEVKTQSRLALYVFNPALNFNSMITTKTDNEVFTKVLMFAILLFVTFTILVYLCNHFLFKFSQDMRSALLLSTTFPNSGNFGLPIILFAFGQIGFDRAVVFTVFQSFIMNSIGVYFASNSKIV